MEDLQAKSTSIWPQKDRFLRETRLGSAHLQQNGPQTDHSRGGKKTERWRESKSHKETTKRPALGGRGRLERISRKTLLQRKPRKLRTHGKRREEKQHWNAGKTRDAQDPELLALMGRKEKRHSFQNHRKLSKQIWWRRRHLKTDAGEKH